MAEPVPFIARARKKLLTRPMPPEGVFDALPGFTPAPELAEWSRATFIEWGGALHNEEHEHLEAMQLGFLWASALCDMKGRRVLGTCEIVGQGERKTWAAQRHAVQIKGWFNTLPDFIITIDATAALTMNDRAFCHLIEHELYHAGQAKDDAGEPRFDKRTGAPVPALREHDFEDFIGTVVRYGAANETLAALIKAAQAGPSVDDEDLWMACGTGRCARRAA
jgi:hypothetical protein